jgi:hypothetical protein
VGEPHLLAACGGCLAEYVAGCARALVRVAWVDRADEVDWAVLALLRLLLVKRLQVRLEKQSG